MTDQAELSDVQHRLDDLEDRLHVEYPVPDTCAGGAQRVRIEVPTPRSLMTVGARGSATSEGAPLGPGGIALRTVESFGAEIKGRACIDTDGLTIFHAVDAARLLTQADLGIASRGALRVGTTEGNIEITAGDVPVNDPAFTVDPSMAVPDAPDVATGAPREAIAAAKGTAGVLWAALEVASSINTWRGFLGSMSLTSGVAAGTLFARIAGLINATRTAWAIGDAAVAAGAAAAAACDLDLLDTNSSGAPKTLLHGAGGVELTSPAAVTAFAPKLSFTARSTASLKAALKVSVKSAGYTSVYGGGTVSVSSEGPAVLKSTRSAATIAGKYAEVSAKETAVLRSDGRAMISAKTAIAVESRAVAVGGGEYVGVSSGDMVQVEAPYVHTLARTQNTISSDEKIVIKANQSIEMEAGGMKVMIQDRTATFDSGGATRLVIDPDRCQVFGVRVERTRTRIRGNVDLG